MTAERRFQQISGRVYDLPSLYARLNRLYFENRIECDVVWAGSRTTTKARRRVVLGSYCQERKRITLSRRLDRPDVPLFFVEYVLFHEMLHALFPREPHRMHTEKFLKFEKMFADYDRAIRWEKENLKILMSASQPSLFSQRPA